MRVKQLIVTFSLCIPNLVFAWSQIDLLAAVSCNNVIDRPYYQYQFEKAYGPSTRTEGGALWFKGKGELFGSSVKEIFVSDRGPWQLVGVVLEASPKVVVESIRTARFLPTNMFFNEAENRWVGSDTRQLVWHAQKFAKLYCIGYKDER